MRYILVQITDTLSSRGPVPSSASLWLEFVLAVIAGMVLSVTAASQIAGEAGIVVAFTVFWSATIVAAFELHRTYPHATFGACNLVSMLRLALTAALASLLVLPAPLPETLLWAGFAIAVIALLSDGVDGWLARRAGLVSQFGARFDMEVDSLFALVLALVAFKTGQAGVWVILLGLPRYAFLLAGLIWPQLTKTVPDTFWRKAVCVLQIGTLVAFLVPVLPSSALIAAAALAALALVWSFATDIRFLLAKG